MKPDMSGIENIGARLRRTRRERDITQIELGEMSGTTQMMIQKIENGSSIQPRSIMEIAEALGVNPAWLQFGEPWAKIERPPTTNAPAASDFTTWLALADQVINTATKDQVAETARLLALNLAHYQIKFGEIPLENFTTLMETQEMDTETGRLVATGMENLVGVLGLIINQAEGANETVQ